VIAQRRTARSGRHTAPRRAAGQVTGGFTLVELLTIIIILGMLITLAAPSMLKARLLFRQSTTMAYLGTIGGAIASYQMDWKDCPYERDQPLFLRGLPRSDGTGAGKLKGRYALVAALTGYLSKAQDGAEGPGARWRKGQPGKVFGPYVESDQPRGRLDGDTKATPAFLDAFGNEILYYRFNPSASGGGAYNTEDNDSLGPNPLSQYLRDPNTQTLYRRDYVLLTPGADRQWMKRTQDLKKTDDMSNFEYTFEKSPGD